METHNTDLTSAFYQILLAKESMKYCRVATSYRGFHAYTQTAMGMPGSETALKKLMCQMLGALLTAGAAAKIANDFYCGGNTPEDLPLNWSLVLRVLNNLQFSRLGIQDRFQPTIHNHLRLDIVSRTTRSQPPLFIHLCILRTLGEGCWHEVVYRSIIIRS